MEWVSEFGVTSIFGRKVEVVYDFYFSVEVMKVCLKLISFKLSCPVSVRCFELLSTGK